MKVSIEKIKSLLEKYYEARTSLEEEQQLFEYFASEEIPAELQKYQEEFRAFSEEYAQVKAPNELVEKIISASYEKSFQEKRASNSLSINRYLLLAASICLLALSFAIGFYSGDQRSQIAERETGDINSLQQEIREMKSLMVQNFLDQQENHQKLYALSLASQFDSIEGEILDRVLTTLKHDKNVNIRLAAADLLYQFAANREVQKGLVEVFPNQESPLVILELIKILKSLQPDTSQALLDEIIKQESLKDSLKEQILTTYKAI